MASRKNADTDSHLHNLEGGPLLTNHTRDPSSLRECHLVQGAFIEFFTGKLLPRFFTDLAAKGMTPVDDKDLRRVMKIDFQSAVISKTGEAFRGWFDSNAHGITQRDFEAYAVGKGPEVIFREIFPNISIEDFLDECFNEVEAGFYKEDAGRRSFIRESTHQSAITCLSSGTND
jgi:hypothetical protein